MGRQGSRYPEIKWRFWGEFKTKCNEQIRPARFEELHGGKVVRIKELEALYSLAMHSAEFERAEIIEDEINNHYGDLVQSNVDIRAISLIEPGATSIDDWMKSVVLPKLWDIETWKLPTKKRRFWNKTCGSKPKNREGVVISSRNVSWHQGGVLRFSHDTHRVVFVHITVTTDSADWLPHMWLKCGERNRVFWDLWVGQPSLRKIPSALLLSSPIELFCFSKLICRVGLQVAWRIQQYWIV